MAGRRDELNTRVASPTVAPRERAAGLRGTSSGTFGRGKGGLRLRVRGVPAARRGLRGGRGGPRRRQRPRQRCPVAADLDRPTRRDRRRRRGTLTRAAAADFTGTGKVGVAVGTGPGTPNRVRLLDGTTGAAPADFQPLEASFAGGLFLAVGDLNADGVPDLVVTPDRTGPDRRADRRRVRRRGLGPRQGGPAQPLLS